MSQQESEPKIKSGSGLKTAVKIICFSLAGIIILAILALWGISIYFSPERIAGMIREKSPEYINGQINISALRYKLFSTYPWLEIEADSILIISHSLNSLPPALKNELPSDADSLAFIEKFQGKINIRKLFKDEIDLRDIIITRPSLNIVMANDSVNNFSIASPDKFKKLKKPEKIKVSEINIEAPLDFSLAYLPDKVDVGAEVSKFCLTRQKKNSYSLAFDGYFSGRYGEIELPQKIPASFDLTASLNYPKFSLNLSDLSVSVGDISMDLKADITASPGLIDFKEAYAEIELPDLFALLEMLPTQFSRELPLPQGLSGNLPVKLAVSLLSPYELEIPSGKPLQIEKLPAINARIFVNDANIAFAPKGEKPIEADDIVLEAEGNFIPDDNAGSWFKLAQIRLNGEGISLEGNMNIGNLTGDVQDIEAQMSFDSSLMSTLSYLLPKFGYKISGHLEGNIDIAASLSNFGKEGVKDVSLKGNLATKSLNIKGKEIPSLAITNLKADYDAFLPQLKGQDYQGSKIDFNIGSKKIKASSGRNSNVEIGNLSFSLNVDDTVPGGMSPDGILKIDIGDLSLKNNGTVVSTQGLKLNAKGHLVSSPGTTPSQFSLPSDADSRLLENKIQHTPVYLEYEGGGILQSMLNLIALNADVSLKDASFSSPAYLYPFLIKDAYLSTDLNRLSFGASRVGIGRTSFSIGGMANGIGDFLTAYYPVLLTADADINFSEVDINQLAWGYYGALMKAGNDSVFYIPPVKPYNAGDSVCVLIPRNLAANIRLHANGADYMQYHFSPLSTNIILKDGVATLNRLTVGAPYGTVAVDWTYSTRQIDNIFMNLKANIERFSFEPFYNVFPGVISKAKELQNLNGEISADIDCNFLMYPSMFMIAPSLKAKFDIHGNNFRFARNGKIERLTHLMLIHGDEPIAVKNFQITGGLHDNLLQINPFRLNFDGYQIAIGGINNMAGEMYYHIALEKSPFHLPFGVNLEGDMEHPEVKMGGTSFNDSKDSRIIQNLEWDPQVDIMAYLKNGWLQFIQIAAKYAGQHSNPEQP